MGPDANGRVLPGYRDSREEQFGAWLAEAYGYRDRFAEVVVCASRAVGFVHRVWGRRSLKRMFETARMLADLHAGEQSRVLVGPVSMAEAKHGDWDLSVVFAWSDRKELRGFVSWAKVQGWC